MFYEEIFSYVVVILEIVNLLVSLLYKHSLSKLAVVAQVVQVTYLFLCNNYVTVMDQLKNLSFSYW